MNVATRRSLSAADLNFNPARFPLGRLADFAREHWGVEGELTPLDGERPSAPAPTEVSVTRNRAAPYRRSAAHDGRRRRDRQPR